MAKLWKGKEGIVTLDAASSVTITTDALLPSFFSSGTEIQSYLKNWTLALPEGTINKVDLLGIDANGYVNGVLDEQPPGLATLSGTLVVDQDEVLETFFMPSPTGIPSTSSTHSRYYPGKVTGRPEIAALVNFDIATSGLGSGSNKSISFVLDNAWGTKYGDVKMSGPDSHLECDFSITCLPKDVHGPEYED